MMRIKTVTVSLRSKKDISVQQFGNAPTRLCKREESEIRIPKSKIVKGLLHCYTLSQVAGLINITPSHHRYVVS